MSDSQAIRGLIYVMPGREKDSTMEIVVKVDKKDWYKTSNELFDMYEAKAIELWKAELKKLSQAEQ